MANYKFCTLFEEECAQMVPGDNGYSNSLSDYPTQWSPYSASTYDSPMHQLAENGAASSWDLIGSPAALDDGQLQSVPVCGQQQLQAYTFDGQLIKSEPTTLLDCLKTTTTSAASNADQYHVVYHHEQQQKQQHMEEARVKMEETCRLAQQIAYSDVTAACRALRISPDPVDWSVQSTREWLLWTCQQYKDYGLSVNHLLGSRFAQIDGFTLSLMTDADFKEIPNGECLMWALEIWKGANETLKMEQRSKSAESYLYLQHQMSSPSNTDSSYTGNDTAASTSGTLYGQTNYAASSSSSQQSYCFDNLSVSSPGSIPDSGLDGSCGSEDGDLEGFGSEPVMGASSGSHTHLWQFLKEMLGNPRYKSAIRWTDRAQGIFKIDDSGLVARKWGERKHRPAMNYDKLSRSIRQYYKKGIMKKTARSQRLVYQFCSHYAN